MAQKENSLLGSAEVDKLVTLIEEATRATAESPRRFIEPARGTLDRAKSKRHHLVFGRRGSGKTSLLRKAGADLTLDRIPIAFIDLEAFKGHTYPDVLLSVLIETLNAFNRWLETAGLNPASKTTFWKRWWGGTPQRPPLNKKKVEEVRNAVKQQCEELTTLLHREDDSKLTARVTSNQKLSSRETDEARISVTGGGLSGTLGDSSTLEGSIENERELVEATKRSKINFLHRRIIDFQKLFERIVDLSKSDAYVFLDDLYHIARHDQAHVLDYFHRIIKGRAIWLKVGTIRHRTDWYRHGDPPTGLKLGDDCDEIDLDITLEKYEIAKRFLLQILDQLIVEAGLAGHAHLLADGGIERLVLERSETMRLWV